MTTYYVAADGSDTNSGTSEAFPWKTQAKVQAVHDANGFLPGDTICYKGAHEFTGGLAWTKSGTAGSGRILITAYGSGRPLWLPGIGSGFAGSNCGHVQVIGLEVVGAGRATNRGAGIYMQNGNGTKLSGAVVDDNVIRGFGGSTAKVNGTPKGQGVYVGGFRDGDWGDGSPKIPGGYDGAQILRNYIEDCAHSAIAVAGQYNVDGVWSNSNFTISENTCLDIKGDPNCTWRESGNGIVVQETRYGTCERNIVRRCGELCGTGWGPVGVLFQTSSDWLVRKNISTDNRAINTDGGGFDIDGGCSDCIMEHNYSARNGGPGLYFFEYGSQKASRRNIMRHNISIDDGIQRDNGLAVRYFGGTFELLQVYGNLVVRSDAHPRQGAELLELSGNVYVYNNIFGSSQTVSQGGLGGDRRGNNYFGGMAGFVSGDTGGTTHDPGYANLGSTEDQTLTSASQLESLTAYRLLSGSPLFTSGVDVSSLLTSAQRGTADFAGDALPADLRAVGPYMSPYSGEEEPPPEPVITYEVQQRIPDGAWSTLVSGLSSPSYNWTTSGLPDGPRELRLFARDASDNAVSPASTTRTITITHPVVVVPPAAASTLFSLNGTYYPILEVQEDWTITGGGMVRMFDNSLRALAYTITRRWRVVVGRLTAAERLSLLGLLSGGPRVVIAGPVVQRTGSVIVTASYEGRTPLQGDAVIDDMVTLLLTEVH